MMQRLMICGMAAAVQMQAGLTAYRLYAQSPVEPYSDGWNRHSIYPVKRRYGTGDNRRRNDTMIQTGKEKRAGFRASLAAGSYRRKVFLR